MSNYKIITDSSADFTNAEYQAMDVTYAPLTVLFQGQAHDNFSDEADVKMFYNGLRNGEMPTTSAVNPDGWERIMEPVLQEGKDILCLAFTSGLSTTYQSAVIASQELMERYPQRKIVVIDTLCAALGQGLLVWHACQKRDAGWSLEELAAWVEDNKLHVCHWITVEDLFHLKRGGRVSATSAVVGTMLNIKPILCVNDEGKLQNTAKVRGRKASMEHLCQKFAEHATDRENVFIVHGDCLEEAQVLEKTLKEKHGAKNVHIGYLGGVIGAHTGPGVLAIFFLGDHR